MRTTATTRRGGHASARLARIARSGAGVLAALSGRTARVEVGEIEVHRVDDLVGRITQPLHVLRMQLTDDRGSLAFTMHRREAVTLAGLAVPGTTDVEILEQRLAPVADAGHLRALEDVAWLFAERGDRVLRELTAGRVGMDAGAVATLTPDEARSVASADRPVGALRVRLGLDQIPPTDLSLIADPRALELLDAVDPIGFLDRELAPRNPCQAPIDPPLTGVVVHSFLVDEASNEIARRCCAKLGFEVVRHPGTTAPNPSLLRGGFVLLDIPAGFDRRFDWCQRLKQGRPELVVALLVHQPSRARVLRGFEVRADAVIGWPIDALELALRLRKLVASSRLSSG